MIENFVFILHNAIRTPPGEFLPSVPLLQQINDPDFHPKACEWKSVGQTFTRPIDGRETLTARALPDGSGIVVLQDKSSCGSANVAIFGSSNVVRRRIVNPYRASRYFAVGDKFWFDAIRVNADEVTLHIQVHRELPGKPYDATPFYEASYDPASWTLAKLDWKPWT